MVHIFIMAYEANIFYKLNDSQIRPVSFFFKKLKFETGVPAIQSILGDKISVPFFMFLSSVFCNSDTWNQVPISLRPSGTFLHQ